MELVAEVDAAHLVGLEGLALLNLPEHPLERDTNLEAVGGGRGIGVGRGGGRGRQWG